MITRRTFMNQSVLATCALALPRVLAAAESNTNIDGANSLQAHAHKRGLLAGCAVGAANLKDDAFTSVLAAQFGLVVAENAMKFGPIKPKPDTYFFDDADALVNFAHQHNIKVRGHNFVWHEQLPTWFKDVATKDNARKILTDHIMTVGGRYKGKMQSWDVVNEAIQVSDGRPDGLRKSPWLELIGPDYLEIAFHTAHQADPKARLTYNEYGIENDGTDDVAKCAATLDLLKRLKAANVPLHALGIQSHINVGESWGKGLRELIDGAKALGLEVYLTELDVNDKTVKETDVAAPADLADIDRIVAGVYTSYLSVALESKAVKSVLTWGLTDAHTWLAGFMRPHTTDDKQPPRPPQRPLPFDPDLKPAPAFFAMRDVFDKAPHR
jgi:endo-1,4-beta-xylanase